MDPDPRAYILHRPPALFLDRVLEIGATTARAVREVRSDATVDGDLWEPWLIEGLAQTAAVLNGKTEQGAGQRTEKGMLVGLRGVAIHRAPRAGETLRFEIELIKRITPLSLMQGRVYAGDELVAEGELKFYVEVAA